MVSIAEPAEGGFCTLGKQVDCHLAPMPLVLVQASGMRRTLGSIVRRFGL